MKANWSRHGNVFLFCLMLSLLKDSLSRLERRKRIFPFVVTSIHDFFPFLCIFLSLLHLKYLLTDSKDSNLFLLSIDIFSSDSLVSCSRVHVNVHFLKSISVGRHEHVAACLWFLVMPSLESDTAT